MASNKGIQLIADIGGTNVRFGIVRNHKIENIKVLSCADYPGPADAALAYLKDVNAKPQTGVFAVAAPLDGSDTVAMSNHVWAFSIEETRKKTGLSALRVVNDFTALALAVPHLAPEDYRQVGDGTAAKNMPIGIIGPGTGLGVAAVIFVDGKPVAIPTEGGHVTMPATTAREYELFSWLRQTKYRHVSAERVCSGKGLVNLHNAISAVDFLDLPEKEPAEITEAAIAKTCPVCVESLNLFTHFLGIIAGNLALTYGAFGGIYIAGGIVPRLGDAFDGEKFRASFLAKGRFRDYMGRIPTFVVTEPYPGLKGLMHLAEEAAPLEIAPENAHSYG